MTRQIGCTLQDKERELATYAIDTSLSDDNGPLVLALINKFINAYSDKLEGRFVDDVAIECLGGSRINYIFHHIFKNSINTIDPF